MKSDGINISIRKVVGVNAGRIRVQRGFSQTFAAERSGIDRSALNKFEVGKFNPSLEWLCKLADGLDAPVVEFFSGLEDARPSECAAVLMTDAGE